MVGWNKGVSVNKVINGVIWTIYGAFALSTDGRFCDLVECKMYVENGRELELVNGQGYIIHEILNVQYNIMGFVA